MKLSSILEEILITEGKVIPFKKYSFARVTTGAGNRNIIEILVKDKKKVANIKLIAKSAVKEYGSGSINISWWERKKLGGFAVMAVQGPPKDAKLMDKFIDLLGAVERPPQTVDLSKKLK